MSRQDPGAATGQPITEPTRCLCSHSIALHKIMPNGSRGACSSSLCGCRYFRDGPPEPEPLRTVPRSAPPSEPPPPVTVRRPARPAPKPKPVMPKPDRPEVVPAKVAEVPLTNSTELAVGSNRVAHRARVLHRGGIVRAACGEKGLFSRMTYAQCRVWVKATLCPSCFSELPS